MNGYEPNRPRSLLHLGPKSGKPATERPLPKRSPSPRHNQHVEEDRAVPQLPLGAAGLRLLHSRPRHARFLRDARPPPLAAQGFQEHERVGQAAQRPYDQTPSSQRPSRPGLAEVLLGPCGSFKREPRDRRQVHHREPGSKRTGRTGRGLSLLVRPTRIGWWVTGESKPEAGGRWANRCWKGSGCRATRGRVRLRGRLRVNGRSLCSHSAD